MLQIDYQKIENFSNVSNVKTLSNAAVLMYTTGTTKQTLHLFAIEGVKDTKEISLVQTLLIATLADFKGQISFAKEHGEIVVDGETIKTGLEKRAVRVLKPFLKTDTIWKTDSKGVVNKAITLKNHLLLQDTCLVVKASDAITSQKGKIFKAAMHNQAKAIVSQFDTFATLRDNIAIVLNELKSADKTTKKNTKKATKKEDVKTTEASVKVA